MELLIGLLIWAGICGAIGMMIGTLGGKKNGSLGIVLGAILGPIGWIIVAVVPASAAVAKPAQPTEQDRIAKLEAELASLKAREKSKKDMSDDGEVPTYRLD